MNELEELLKKTSYTSEDWKVFMKVQRHNQLEDLKFLLEEMLENEEITKQQYEDATQNAKLIVEKFDKWLEYDWIRTMKDAIYYTIEE